MQEPQHFSDYGFDPQIDYFQVLEEAVKQKRDTKRSTDCVRFKLQKPIAKEEYSNKKHWWKNLFKWKWTHRHVHQARANYQPSISSGPLYFTHSTSGPTSPYRTTARPLHGHGTLSPAAAHVGVPYLTLREFNVEQRQRISTSALPLYLVT